MQNIFMEMFLCRSRHTKIAVGEWNFQWKSSGKLPTMCLQKLWDWTPGKIFENCLGAEKLQLMKAGSCWILQKDLKKGRRSQGTMSWAAPPKAEILNGVQRCTELCLGFSRRELVGYSPAKQNHQSAFFERCCCILLAPSPFYGQQPRGPSTPFLSRCFRTLQSQSLWF